MYGHYTLFFLSHRQLTINKNYQITVMDSVFTQDDVLGLEMDISMKINKEELLKLCANKHSYWCGSGLINGY